MRYHLCKKSRSYLGHPYRGPASDNVVAESMELPKARIWRDILTKRNPVGWDIYDSKTGEVLE